MKIALTIAILAVSGCSTLMTGEVPENGARDRTSHRERVESARVESVSIPTASLHAHPRLMTTNEDLERIQKLIATDATARQWSQRILQEARKAATAPPLRYEAAKGIENARELQRRVTHLAIAYRLTNEASFLDAAKNNLLVACQFPEWEQPSFLATAEMSASVAIGYDWLFGSLSQDERAIIRDALVTKGLRPGMSAYASNASWVEAHHNWNLVCNGGMTVAALAVLDESPEVARPVLTGARRSIVNGLENFDPDGGWEEGPTYWNYGTRYLAFMVAALRSATGSMQGLESFPGVAQTGDFRIHTLGPSGKNFNFADASEAPGDSPQMFALAWAFKRPQDATFERNRSHNDPSVFDLLWYQPNDNIQLSSLPTSAIFKSVGVAALRGSFDDPNTTYVAFKGGSNRAHHGHLDIGSFVLDALGQRWAMDLGSDNYDLPTKLRWTYYRYSSAGHNTLTINGRNQNEAATAPLIAFHQAEDRSYAVADLTEAYDNAKRVLRGIELLHGRDVLVQDEIRLEKDAQVTWTMHTQARVDLQADGRTAIMRLGGKTMTARLLDPVGAKFVVEPVVAPTPQNPITGVARLVIRFRTSGAMNVAVLFSPAAGEIDLPKMQPVSAWKDDGALRKRK